MKFKDIGLNGVFLIELEKREDARGFFARAWCREEFAQAGLVHDIAQVNLSFNKDKGTVRGMHYQKPPYEEVKIVSCAQGAIFDVVIDVREDSPTKFQWYGVELTAGNGKMLYVPKGFAHGYQTIQEETAVIYFVSQAYVPSSENGVHWADPRMGVEWPIVNQVIVSDKDAAWPLVR